MRPFNAGALLREARSRAGLSQRELARRAGTAQSVIARIERGLISPRVSTLSRVLEAAGYEITAEITPTTADPRMLEDLPRILGLTPEERLIEVRNLSRFERSARRA